MSDFFKKLDEIKRASNDLLMEDDAETENRFFKEMESLQKKGSVNRDFYGAAVFARKSIKTDGLCPVRDLNGNLSLTEDQSTRLLSSTKEDVVSLIFIQNRILGRLEAIKYLLTLILFGLLFIAYRLLYY